MTTNENSQKTGIWGQEYIAKFIHNLKTKISWRIGTGVAVIVFLIGGCNILFGHKKDRIHARITEKAEEREIYKEKDLRKSIRNEPVRFASRQSSETTAKSVRKRNYDTEMAVYVYEEKKEPEYEHRSQNQREVKKLGIPAGTKIPAYLSGTLFSYNVEAPVIAVVTKDIEWNGKVVIPQRSKFLGEAGVLKSLNRINVLFDLLILPDGKQIRVRALALSQDGSAGIKGRVKKHRDMRILKAIGEGVLGMGSLFTGRRTGAYSLENQIQTNLSENLLDMARQDLRGVKVESSVTVDSQTPIEVILLQAI